MPELPEVEAMRRLLENYCAGRTISTVLAKEAGGGPRDGQFDNKVVGEGVTEEQLVAALQSRKVKSAQRRGKQLWLELEGDGPHLLLHAGMTGALVVEGEKPFTFQSFKVEEGNWPPKFTKLQLFCEDAETGAISKLAFADPRRFGKVLLRERPLESAPVSELAPDPLSSPFPLEPFAQLVKGSTAPIKALLLNQEKAVCGVGNWVADEVLHTARLHPAAVARTLSDSQVEALHAAILSVLRFAVDVDADYLRFPPDWLFRVRWKQGPNGSGVFLPDGAEVSFSEVGGRTTAFVAARQRMGERSELEVAPKARRRAAAAQAEVAATPPKRRGKKEAEATPPKRRGRKEADAAPPKRGGTPAPAKRRAKEEAAPARRRGKEEKALKGGQKRPAAASFRVPLRSKKAKSFGVALPGEASLEL